jgi:hypothetical protein
VKDGLKQVGGIIDAILARVGTGRAPELVRLIEDWDQLAGDGWAGLSRPVRLKEGELLVEVDGGTQASLLRYRVPDLLRSLETNLGMGVVESVVLRVARPGRPPAAPA